MRTIVPSTSTQFVIAKNDVQRLIPWHLIERHVDRPLHRLIDHDVQAADVGESAQHGAQIRTLKIERDRVSGETRARPRPVPLASVAVE